MRRTQIDYFKVMLVSMLIVLLMVIVIPVLLRATRDIETVLNSFVGESVIIGNDTVTIIDYNAKEHTFTLNNGQVVSSETVIKSKKIK